MSWRPSAHYLFREIHEGISVKTQELYLLVFVCRYLDLFENYSTYNTIFKVMYILVRQYHSPSNFESLYNYHCFFLSAPLVYASVRANVVLIRHNNYFQVSLVIILRYCHADVTAHRSIDALC